MHRDSTTRLIRLLLTSEEAAIKWHSRPVPEHIRRRLSLPRNTTHIAALASQSWPPVASERAEVGTTRISALVLGKDHMVNWAVDTTLQGFEPEEPRMTDGVLTWWITPTRRAYWWLVPLAVIVPLVAADAPLVTVA